MEIIQSFFNNIKDKLTNPFFGTLIIVLILHHWEFLFTLFNFDKDCTLNEKIVILENYISKFITIKSFLLDIIQAISYMLVGYLIILFTRSLTLAIEHGIMPFITGKIVNKNVVLRSEYEDVLTEREKYFDQYEEQRKNVRNFSRTIDEQTEQIMQKDKDLIKQSETISSTVKNLDITKQKLEKLENLNIQKQTEINNLTKSLSNIEKESNFQSEKIIKLENLIFNNSNQEFYSSKNNFPPIILEKVKELKKAKKWRAFYEMGKFFERGGSLDGTLLTEMIKRGLANERNSSEDFTPLGKFIWNYFNILDIESTE